MVISGSAPKKAEFCKDWLQAAAAAAADVSVAMTVFVWTHVIAALSPQSPAQSKQ